MAEKKRFWKQDWFTGLVICVAVGALSGSAFVGGLERWAYDVGARWASQPAGDTGAGIDIVAIDDDSIRNLGRWPWPRDLHAQLIAQLTGAGAKVIAPTIFYSEAQVDPGLAYINDLTAFYEGSPLASPGLEGALQAAARELGDRLRAARQALATDSKLAATLEQSGNTVLSMQFVVGEPIGNPESELPDFVLDNAIPPQNINLETEAARAGWTPLPTTRALLPIEQIGAKADALGHLTLYPDIDGAVRTEPLVVNYYEHYFPSQALLAAARSLNLDVEDIRVNVGESVQLGKLLIETDGYSQMRTFFYQDEGGKSPFRIVSAFDVLTEQVRPESFEDKIVLIGPTAIGVGAPQQTPIAGSVEPALIMAHAVASILNEDFFIEPGWAPLAKHLAFLGIAVYLIALLPRLKAGPAFAFSAVLLAVLLGSEWGLMVSQSAWVQFMTASLLLVLGHVLITTKRFLVTEAGKLRSEEASAQSNKMLGLAYQQQGNLDMAFDNFRKCPMTEEIMENLYSLASDYESKRRFNKAMAVYEFMAKHDPKFRDLETKMRRAKAMEETVMLGGSGGGSAAGTLILDDGSVSKPMLGRYQVEKELGKGAMGVVYLGRDPKINRVVAIKTMALSQEFEADELEDVKARFFREAETAGRLQHPNIVTIYDAGEEHDLAYIAMEFLEGHDMTRYTRADELLPLPLVMAIVFKAAQALDYAHKQNVVHRDIKPANVMYDPANKSIKITDFGIARITDSSRTKTGMVLGTPSYMSPEQLAGKKVDGRSDLFSLGVMLYQLVTSKLPFKGESMATLMYKIANEPHPELFELKPELAKTKPCLADIIDKALQKDPDKRYQTGLELARDLQACAKQGTKPT